MKRESLKIEYAVYDDISELPPKYLSLLERADQARDYAYAPYSGFYVGVALLMENDKFITGANQENASFPVGTCAEIVALNCAYMQYPENKILAIALSAKSDRFSVKEFLTPCGKCRQAIYESERKQQLPIMIVLKNSIGKVMVFEGISSLLPFVFHEDQLKI